MENHLCFCGNESQTSVSWKQVDEFVDLLRKSVGELEGHLKRKAVSVLDWRPFKVTWNNGRKILEK